jgi:hypothetical protein
VAHAYTPGLAVLERTEIRRRRLLPLKGEVLVAAGDRVNAGTIVARTLLPGQVMPVAAAQGLGVEASELPPRMVVAAGAAVEAGQTIARARSFFGLVRREVASPVAGMVESISKRTGQVMVRARPQALELDAYVDGVVDSVMPEEGVEIVTVGSLVQGIFGIGGERRGPLRVLVPSPESPLEASAIPDDARGAVLVGGSFADAAAFRRAEEVGAAALVVGGFDDLDLRAILGYDLGVAVTGQETVRTALVLTEGFGRLPMAAATFELLRARDGRAASVNGATQIRAGVVRPEIIVPAQENEGAPGAGGSEPAERQAGRMERGSRVRIIREPWFGLLGTVEGLPHDPVTIETGARVRVVRVELDGGTVVVLPRANVELIER